MQKGLSSLLVAPLYIVGFVLVGLLSAYLTFKVMSFSKTVEAPDLSGKSVIEANDLLTRKGLNMKIEGEDYDPLILSGRIIRQDIPPGSKVKEQRGIRVILSKGPKVWSVPDIAGSTLSEAESILAKSGLRVNKVIRVHSDTIESGRIIAQRPTPDEAIKESISLVVSSGPYAIIYYSPDFTNKRKEEVMTIAERTGLKIEFSGAGSMVRSQRPKPNSVIRSGETIYLQMEGEAY